MGHRKKKKVFGFLVFALGLGILLAILIPAIGWILFSGLVLIVGGIYLLRNCG